MISFSENDNDSSDEEFSKNIPYYNNKIELELKEEEEEKNNKEDKNNKNEQNEHEEDDYNFKEKIMKDRLKRRTELINDLRKGYLRDIVSLKMFIQEYLANDERKEIYNIWKSSIPSLDLRQHLMLYSPFETSINMLPCDSCGGSIEIVHHESSELEALSKALSHTDKTKHDLKVIIGTKTAQLESLEKRWDLETRKHRDEKKILYREIKDLKANKEALVTENDEIRSSLSKLRAENNEYIRASRDAIETRDQLHQSLLELDRCKTEMRHIEEEMAALQIHRGIEADKLIVMTKSRDQLEKKLATALAERDTEKLENSRIKANYEAIQKREMKLQNQIEMYRRDIEDLQMTNSQISSELEGVNSVHTIELEGLEKLCDSLRTEHEIMSRSLEEAQNHMSQSIQEKEECEANLSRLQQIYQTYRSDKDKEIQSLNDVINQQINQISELTGQVREFEAKFKRFETEMKESSKRDEEREKKDKARLKIERELRGERDELEKQSEKLKTKIQILERQLAMKRDEERANNNNNYNNGNGNNDINENDDSNTNSGGNEKEEQRIKRRSMRNSRDNHQFSNLPSARRDSKSLRGGIEVTTNDNNSNSNSSSGSRARSPSPSPKSVNENLGKYVPISRTRGKPPTSSQRSLASATTTPDKKKQLEKNGSKYDNKQESNNNNNSNSNYDNEYDYDDYIITEDKETQVEIELLQPDPREVKEKEKRRQYVPLSEEDRSLTSFERLDSNGDYSYLTNIERINTASSQISQSPSRDVIKRVESNLEREDREEREREDALVANTSYGIQNMVQSKRLQAFSGLQEGEVIIVDDPDELIEKSTALIIETEKMKKRDSWIQKFLQYFKDTARISRLRRNSIPKEQLIETILQDTEIIQREIIPSIPEGNESSTETMTNINNPSLITTESNSNLILTTNTITNNPSLTTTSNSNIITTLVSPITTTATNDVTIHSDNVSESGFDIEEDTDAIEREMGVEISKIWNLLMSGITDALSNKLTEDELGRLLKTLSPITIEFASSLAKATMGMWRGLMIAKQSADLLCNIRHLVTMMRPHYGFSSEPGIVENVKIEFKSPSLFSREQHLWRMAYSLDPTLLRAIEKEEREMTDLQHITERKLGGDISFFGDDPKIRSFQYDIALSSLIQMKDYFDSMQMPTQVSLRQFCNDWATTKISALDAEKGDRIFIMSNRIRTLEVEKEEREKMLKDMSIDIRRVNEFKERIREFSKRDKEWKDKDEKSKVEIEKLEQKCDEAQTTCYKLELELNYTNKKIEYQEQQIENLTAYTASYERDKELLEIYQEKEKIRQSGLVEGGCQTERLGIERAIQTEFIAPPISLKHAIRQPISMHNHPISSLSSTHSINTSTTTGYPLVTPQYDESSLYSVSLSQFTGYDPPNPGNQRSISPSIHSHANDSIPSNIFINTDENGDGGGEGDISVVSSVWSSLELDELSDIRDPLHSSSIQRSTSISLQQSMISTPPIQSMNDLRKYKKDMTIASTSLRPSTVASPISSSSLTSSTSTFLSPVRIPSASKLRTSSSSHSTRLYSASTNSSPLTTKSSNHLYPVDSMSSQSIKSNQSVNDILQLYQKNHDSSVKNNNRKWLQSR